MSKHTHITTSSDKTPAPPGGRPQTFRVAPALRHAIKLRIEEGITITEACARAGISEAGWHKAMKRQAVLDHYDAAEVQFIQTVERRRKGYKARAIEVAADLMERGQSEAVRMKAVEFFAGESQQPLVNVNINPNAAAAYTYHRPGKNGATIDSPSNAVDGQAIDITPQSEKD